MKTVCEWCHSEFETNRPKQKYCTKRCNGSAHQARRRQLYNALKKGIVPEYNSQEMLRTLISSVESILNKLKQEAKTQ